MADTFSPFLKIRLPETGAYSNVWGAVLNADAFTLLDAAITGRISVPIGAATAYSLAALSNGAASDSRYFCLFFTGTPGSLVTVTVPASVTRKLYLIDNQVGQSMLFKYAASANTVTVANGERRLIWCDGSDVYNVAATATDATTLGGIAAGNYARLDIANLFVGNSRNAFVTVTEAPSTTIAAGASRSQILTLTGNRTMAAPSGALDGQEIHLLVVQSAGGNTLTWNAIFIHENGVSPVLGSAAGAVDYFILKYNLALNKWVVGHFANASSGAGTTYDFHISNNESNVDVWARVGSPGGGVTVNVTVDAGVVVQSQSTGTPALDTSGFAAGSTINIVNLGYIQGRGGRGGNGGAEENQPSGLGNYASATDGLVGGTALRLPGAGRTVNITNINGHIWGGGGGGGGGGFTGVGATEAASGGGGGGGAGGGEAGRGGATQNGGVNYKAGNGTPGTVGRLGANGVNGGGVAAGGASAGNGGLGGDFGADGVDGTNTLPGQGATAGKAIDKNGGASPTFINGAGSPNVKGLIS